MRISDWSSDVCSSDLRRRAAQADAERHSRPDLRAPLLVAADARSVRRTGQERQDAAEHRTARRLKPGAYSRLCIRAGAAIGSRSSEIDRDAFQFPIAIPHRVASAGLVLGQIGTERVREQEWRNG